MSLRSSPTAQAVLDAADLSADQLLAVTARLEPFRPRYAPGFQRREQRQHAHDLIVGKLSTLTRKTAEPIAHALGRPREGLQDFVGTAPWSDRAVLDQLHPQGLRIHFLA